MCGRFALYATLDELKDHFKIHDNFNMACRYNISPFNMIPVVLGKKRHLDFMRWGFIPKWAKVKDGKMPKAYINARSETVMEKPTFKSAFQRQRCLVPASGYYEWKTIKDKKQPYFITQPKHPVFGFAAIFDTWIDPNMGKIETVAILTTDALGEMQRVHERMPIILCEKDYDDWLNPETKIPVITSMLNPVSELYEISPVSLKVNNPNFDDRSCIHSL